MEGSALEQMSAELEACVTETLWFLAIGKVPMDDCYAIRLKIGKLHDELEKKAVEGLPEDQVEVLLNELMDLHTQVLKRQKAKVWHGGEH